MPLSLVVRRQDQLGGRVVASQSSAGGSEMRWAVEIQHSTLERRNLSDLLAGLGFALFDRSPYPAFTSGEMDTCSTAGFAFELAKKVRTALAGPARIDPEFQLGPVLDFSSEPPKRHAFLEVKSAMIALSSMNATLTLGPPKGLTDRQLEEWENQRVEREYQDALERQRSRLEPAFHCERAERVLDLLNRSEPTGEIIYKIYELVEGHPRNRRRFQKQFNISPEDFARFQDAVHNPVVTGEWARHAYEDALRTAQPMSKSNAEAFVRKIAALWLANVRKRRGK